MSVINGKLLAQEIKKKVKEEIAKRGITPGLAVILIGSDSASLLYIALKEKACKKVGIYFEKYLFSADETEEKIIKKITELNQKKEIDGILVQLPLPASFNENKIIQSIDPKKDVDGFHPLNLNNFLNDKPAIIPGLALGILELIKSTKIDLKNKKTLILANHEIFAKPIIKMMEKNGSEAEFISSSHSLLEEKTREADILITAIGIPKFLKGNMVKKGAVVVDVGINILEGKTVGDVDFESVYPLASFITPVPGGVGPMTIAILLKNVLEIAREHLSPKNNLIKDNKRE